MAKKVTLTRVQGADQEPIQLEIEQIKWVNPATREGRCIVTLEAGRIEVKGTLAEVDKLIEDAKNND